MPLAIPRQLTASCLRILDGAAWLERLPQLVTQLADRWSLTIGAPYENDGSCAWVAPVERADGSPAVLKLGMPHMEAEHEIQGLRFWNGNPTVRLLDFDEAAGAMLLERCVPGSLLREVPEPEQDVILAGLLRRLWLLPADPHPFRPLSTLIGFWSRETLADSAQWADAGLVRAGLQAFAELSGTQPRPVLLATDLHAGNVLRAEREPWLVIDPKPFVGDPGFDATQHLLNCQERLRRDPAGTIRRYADLLEVDHERVRLWTFARLAAEPSEDWANDARLMLATVLSS